MSDISKRILETITCKDISYGDLSDKTGIPKSALQRYATGQTEKIPIDRLEKIASAIGVTTSFLMGWDSADKKEQPADSGELSEAKKAMYDFVDSLSDDQVRRLLQIAHAAFEK
ncbi:helix-turn-helix domain-containing protein [Neglectibacter timonensis]|uniref:helix-turn-helix domain-containing protein n=1 Tax=Neglectibacter timonensis TaxID=1776382 RepID=UPI00248E90AA|nr:helix-turn-helix transcriptional regulator [Neglectibacter timonensis]